ncbi:hypothetical protein CFP71_32435 [Amycolatopsis thailandensis]|uniref:Uncharacterized protein n=1 Tax=Amycolatopsis thailandensis TaxID=589330 RepID=A0A229RP83_9PSEU|nr:hypothetical protein [Amycolatopsis thailandensis]OXM48476.1 hypothetical protein CFP71_32435 [Amycolatopsis thailandensis]
MADKPDSGDIKITVSFLKEFQSGVLQNMVTELESNKDYEELRLTANNTTGKRRLLAGSEAWEPAKLLMDKYELAGKGTAPTLWAQVEVIKERLIQLNRNITTVVEVAEKGEHENIQLANELDMSVLGQVFQTSPTPPPPGPGA